MNGRYPQATPSSTPSSAERSEESAFRLTEAAIRTTMTLMEFETSDPPSKLTEFLNSSQLDGIPVHEYAALWEAGFPYALLTIILDEDWYESFLADSLVSGPGALALSEQSVSVLELLQAAIVRLNCFFLSASDLLQANEPVISDITDTLEYLPSLFEQLWKHRHIVFHTTRSVDANGSSNEKKSVLSDVHYLIVHYCRLYGQAFPNSRAPPFGFTVHIGIYCWYHTSEDERKDCRTPHFMSPILSVTMKQTPRRFRNFFVEVIIPALGSSPAKGISRILTKDRCLTNGVMLRMTINFLGILLGVCPSIIEDVQAAESVLMAVATITQRSLCQSREQEAREYGPYPQDELVRMRTQINLTVLNMIWDMNNHLGASQVQQIIIKRYRYLNFLPHMARCVAVAYYARDTPVINCIEFLIDIYHTVGNQIHQGQSMLIKPADYRQFRQVLQSHWQFITDELQSESSSKTLTPDIRPLLTNRPNASLRKFRTHWQRLRDVYKLSEDLTNDSWSEREMLGCFNVECPCYGLKPLHKLRECKRCRTAHYCNVECQKKDWLARHRSICSCS